MKAVQSTLQSHTDRHLLNRFRIARDREAFGELVHRYGPVVFGICQRVLGDHHSAEDAFQQTFIKLARFVHDIQKPEALAGWLHATATRSALAIAPSRGQQTYLGNETSSRERDPLEEISGRELIGIIEEELAALPKEYRSAILLCGIEGLSID
jgi:RNA polymerase sigma factor (sigma-70 family)